MSIPAIVGSLVVGALAGRLFGGQSGGGGFGMPSMPASYAAPSVPAVPDPGVVKDDGTETETEAAMNAAAEKEKKEAQKRLQGGQEIFTSPLGAPGLASTYRKRLLGAA